MCVCHRYGCVPHGAGRSKTSVTHHQYPRGNPHTNSEMWRSFRVRERGLWRTSAQTQDAPKEPFRKPRHFESFDPCQPVAHRMDLRNELQVQPPADGSEPHPMVQTCLVTVRRLLQDFDRQGKTETSILVFCRVRMCAFSDSGCCGGFCIGGFEAGGGGSLFTRCSINRGGLSPPGLLQKHSTFGAEVVSQFPHAGRNPKQT